MGNSRELKLSIRNGDASGAAGADRAERFSRNTNRHYLKVERCDGSLGVCSSLRRDNENSNVNLDSDNRTNAEYSIQLHG